MVGRGEETICIHAILIIYGLNVMMMRMMRMMMMTMLTLLAMTMMTISTNIGVIIMTLKRSKWWLLPIWKSASIKLVVDLTGLHCADELWKTIQSQETPIWLIWEKLSVSILCFCASGVDGKFTNRFQKFENGLFIWFNGFRKIKCWLFRGKKQKSKWNSEVGYFSEEIAKSNGTPRWAILYKKGGGSRDPGVGSKKREKIGTLR